jgi:hypothetical protein
MEKQKFEFSRLFPTDKLRGVDEMNVLKRTKKSWRLCHGAWMLLPLKV